MRLWQMRTCTYLPSIWHWRWKYFGREVLKVNGSISKDIQVSEGKDWCLCHYSEVKHSNILLSRLLNLHLLLLHLFLLKAILCSAMIKFKKICVHVAHFMMFAWYPCMLNLEFTWEKFEMILGCVNSVILWNHLTFPCACHCLLLVR